MTFTRGEFWWAVGLLLAIVCVGGALLWAALALRYSKRERRRRQSDPQQPPDADLARSPATEPDARNARP